MTETHRKLSQGMEGLDAACQSYWFPVSYCQVGTHLLNIFFLIVFL